MVQSGESEPRVAVVVGAGPGVGASVARGLGRSGYDVALVARTPTTLERLGQELQLAGVTAGWTPLDVTDEPALTAAITRFGEHLGRIDLLHFNPSAWRERVPLLRKARRSAISTSSSLQGLGMRSRRWTLRTPLSRRRTVPAWARSASCAMKAATVSGDAGRAASPACSHQREKVAKSLR